MRQKRRLTVLIAVYLHFRGDQLTYQSNVLVTGMQERTQKLQAELGVFRSVLSGWRQPAKRVRAH
jgi:hypothetical protein